MRDIATAYGRRWDNETAFDFPKRHLDLHMVCSPLPALVVARVVQAMRTGTGANPFKVSLPSLMEMVSLVARQSNPDPLATLGGAECQRPEPAHHHRHPRRDRWAPTPLAIPVPPRPGCPPPTGHCKDTCDQLRRTDKSAHGLSICGLSSGRTWTSRVSGRPAKWPSLQPNSKSCGARGVPARNPEIKPGQSRRCCQFGQDGGCIVSTASATSQHFHREHGRT